jgi:hypothetical protein
MDPLFGSETRALVLDQLAITPRPQSAYRIAKAVGAQPIQVLRILKDLSEYAQHSDLGWVLKNESLRRFLRERSAHREEVNRSEKDEILVRFGMKPRTAHERTRIR